MIAICMFWLGGSAIAQITIEEPLVMDRIIQDYADLYAADEEIEGWSILVGLNRDRRKFDQIQSGFRYRFPEFQEYIEWRFENPYYKLIVGAFTDRKSSLPLLHKIRKSYSGAFQVKNTFPREDVIRFRRLVQL